MPPTGERNTKEHRKLLSSAQKDLETVLIAWENKWEEYGLSDVETFEIIVKENHNLIGFAIKKLLGRLVDKEIDGKN